MREPGPSVPPPSIRPKSLEKLSGREPFKGLDATVVDFWAWAMGDLRMNTVRASLAEFVVGRAVGQVADLRTEWADYDVLSPDGIRIEVKSSAYLQSWGQRALSKISFGRVGTKQAWDAEAGRYVGESALQADVFVFCKQCCTDPDLYDPLDVGQLEFYIAPAKAVLSVLKRTLSEKLVASLSTGPVRFEELNAEIKKVFSERGDR